MERTAAVIAVISAMLAGVFIYFSRPISKRFVSWMRSPASAQKKITLAKVESVNGQVTIRRYDGDGGENEPAIVGAPLYHLDQVIVDGNSTTVLSFQAGYRLKLLSDTELTLQSYRPTITNAPILLTLTNGDYQMLTRGAEGSLFVALNNQIFAPEFRPQPARHELSAQQLQAQKPPQTGLSAHPALASTSAMRLNAAPLNDRGLNAEVKARTAQFEDDANNSAESRVPDKLIVDGRETLSNQYIERKIDSEAGDFRRCQINSLRDNLTAEGSLLFSITISPNGRIDNLQVLQDMLNNSQLADCTRSVLARLHFKSFNGDPVTVNYPIDFR